jgi:hypothetical protein
MNPQCVSQPLWRPGPQPPQPSFQEPAQQARFDHVLRGILAPPAPPPGPPPTAPANPVTGSGCYCACGPTDPLSQVFSLFRDFVDLLGGLVGAGSPDDPNGCPGQTRDSDPEALNRLAALIGERFEIGDYCPVFTNETLLPFLLGAAGTSSDSDDGDSSPVDRSELLSLLSAAIAERTGG